MIVALSYLIAVILTIALAVFLYPIAGTFWVLGLFGKVSEHMFGFTTKIIRSLWRDIRGVEKDMAEQWTCSCGCTNTGKFCSQCGAPVTLPVAAAPVEDAVEVEAAEVADK